MTTISSISGGQQEPNLPKAKMKQIAQMLFDEKKKPKKTQKPQGRTYDYQLGQREGNTRIIGPSGISSQTGISRLNDFFYHFANVDNEANLSGEVGSSRQGRRGDCYLLAEINAIRNTDDGQKILDKNSRYDEATGDYYSNEDVAKRRANTIVSYLTREGIDPARIYVRYIGCTRQPYGNNSLNRCVIVKVG